MEGSNLNDSSALLAASHSPFKDDDPGFMAGAYLALAIDLFRDFYDYYIST